MKKEIQVNEDIIQFVPVIRMLLSDKNLKITRLAYNTLNSAFCNDRKLLKEVFKSFKPQAQFNWDGTYLYLDDCSSPASLITSFIRELEDFRGKYSKSPKIIVIRDYGVLAVANDPMTADLIMAEFESILGGSKKKDAAKKITKANEAKPEENPGILNQKICIVTGGAQGFGEGISRNLLLDNANLVIADLNEEKGLITISGLKELCTNNDLRFVKTDVSKPDSVKNLIFETVKNFGGIDIFVSNAGILKAGGLDEMDPESFELMTKINYEGYFLCTKYASSVLKLQSKYKENYYSDIIQINSKSGLKGSNRNFAYSGGKFGGIGLTQSFALELAPHRVKVNAICPGNFFEGPLWSDPKSGLFVQYLKAGKVPGAKTIEDVRRFYEKQVPLGRGCRVQDVMKALTYIVSQEYETGQAVPVTGGQEMMS